MSHSPDTIARLLRKEMRGEVFEGTFKRSLYATDASIYEIEPACVAYPRDEEDVSSILKIAEAEGILVSGRGSGSGLAGESLVSGIVLDFTAHMNEIIHVREDRKTVRVQPGVVLDVLNEHLRPYRLKFGPDPASSNRATIGGMIANNSTGAHSILCGATRENVAAMRLCLVGGAVTVARPAKMDGPEYKAMCGEPDLPGWIHRELPPLLAKHAALIESRRPKTGRNRAGYLLYDVVRDGTYDLTKLICASEGTLALVTEATLKLVPLPASTGLALAYFPDLISAAEAVPAILETKPSTVECQDAMLLELGRKATPGSAHLFPAEYGAMLIVEFAGASKEEVEARFADFEKAVGGGKTKAAKVARVPDPKEQKEVWAARKASVPLLFQRDDWLQPVPVIEDAAVPPERLAEYLAHVVSVIEKYGLQYSAYAHAGHGELHIRPMMDLRRREHVDLLEKLSAEVYPKAIELGGTISGEHGGGLLRAQWLKMQYGEELYSVFRQVKGLFDARGLLNPDKIITDDEHLMARNLRFGPEYRCYEHGSESDPAMPHSGPGHVPGPMRDGRSEMELNWPPGELSHAVEKCNGCAQCRSVGLDVNMCPRFKHNRIEDSAPRAKANIVRRLLSGRHEEGGFGDERLLDILEYCFHCQLCSHDCPSKVEISRLGMEAKARYVRRRGLSWFKRVLCDSEVWTTLGCSVAPLYNTAASLRFFRFWMEAFFGIDRRRPIPPVVRTRVRRRHDPLDAGRPLAVYFPDLFARYNAPQIAQAAVDVLEHHGYSVEIPDTRWTGFPMLENGDLSRLRRLIEFNAEMLAPYARRGAPIVCTEATAALCMAKEHLWALDTPDTRAVSRNTFDICQFIERLGKEGNLKTDWRPVQVNVGYQAACHHRAMGAGRPSLQMMRLVPGLNVVELNEGCCGIAGTFGITRRNYDESMAIGARLFERIRKPDIDVAATESSTCRIQIEHGGGKPVVHPIQILARAYGYDGGWEPRKAPGAAGG